jgi:hypothetical protein
MRDLLLVAKSLLAPKDFGVGNFFEPSHAVRLSTRAGSVLAQARLLLATELEKSKFNALCEVFSASLFASRSDFFHRAKSSIGEQVRQKRLI